MEKKKTLRGFLKFLFGMGKPEDYERIRVPKKKSFRGFIKFLFGGEMEVTREQAERLVKEHPLRYKILDRK